MTIRLKPKLRLMRRRPLVEVAVVPFRAAACVLAKANQRNIVVPRNSLAAATCVLEAASISSIVLFGLRSLRMVLAYTSRIFHLSSETIKRYVQFGEVFNLLYAGVAIVAFVNKVLVQLGSRRSMENDHWPVILSCGVQRTLALCPVTIRLTLLLSIKSLQLSVQH